MYNTISGSWATVNQSISESKLIKARDVATLIERANDFVNGRAAQFGEIEELDSWFLMIVNILVPVYNYTSTYSPPIEQPIKWTYTDNTGTKDFNTFWENTYNDGHLNINVYDDGHKLIC